MSTNINLLLCLFLLGDKFLKKNKTQNTAMESGKKHYKEIIKKYMWIWNIWIEWYINIYED